MDRMDDHTVAGRVVVILDAVARLGGGTSLAALTRATGLPKPTVRRIAADLVARGLLQRCEDGYRLGPHLLQLGVHAAEQQGLRGAVTPHIQDLFARTGEIVWASAFTDTTNAIVSHAFGSHRAADMRRPWPTAIRNAGFLASAVGKIVLADRPDLAAEVRSHPLPRLTRYTPTNWAQVSRTIEGVRDGGVAIEHEQTMLGYSCIAARVLGRDGNAVGAIGIIGRTGSFVAERLTRPVLDAASAISRIVSTVSPDPPRLVSPTAGDADVADQRWKSIEGAR